MVRLTWVSLSLSLLAVAAPCAAQDAVYADGRATTAAHVPNVSIERTPEMWLYEQERIRYEDPKAAVRRKAELRAARRADRIATMKWYGMSNSRPRVSSTPTMDTYSPYWGSNTYNPYRWAPFYKGMVVIRADASER